MMRFVRVQKIVGVISTSLMPHHRAAAPYAQSPRGED